MPKRNNYILIILSLIFNNTYAQFNTGSITLDGDDNETAYVNAPANSYSICWDNTNLYICKKGGNSSEPCIVYLDIDPVLPITAGSNSNGALNGDTDYGITPKLPFRSDFKLYWLSTTAEYKLDDGSGGWGSATSISTIGNNGSDREISIPWASITGSSRPAAFNFLALCSSTASPTGYSYDPSPSDNPVGTFANPFCEKYWKIENTSSSGTTNPFMSGGYYKSYTFLGTSGASIDSFNIYDFTLNSSGITINKIGEWTIRGSLIVGNGIMDFGSNDDSLIVEDSVIIFSSGEIDMSSSIGKNWLKKNVHNDGNFELSSSSTSQLLLAGGLFKNTGVFSNRSAKVKFVGTTGQVISGNFYGSNRFNFFEINNANGININNVTDSLCINYALLLSNGIISSTSKPVFLANTCTLSPNDTGQSNSWINGIVKREISSSSEKGFPVGTATYKSWIKLEPLNAISNRIYTVKYEPSSKSPGNETLSLSGSLDHTSYVEHWDISCNTNSSTDDDAKITLSWSAYSNTSSTTSDRNSLRICQWKSTSWERQGNTPTITNLSQNYGWLKADSFSSEMLATTLGSNITSNPLPIKLVDFKVISDLNCNQKIIWNTASEINTSHYVLYGSTNGETFEYINTIKAKGNSNTLSHYELEFLNQNFTIIKMIQIDIDGKFEIFYTSAHKCDNISVFPNPSTGIIHINFDSNMPLFIYNHIGQKLFEIEKNQLQIALPKGIYYLGSQEHNFIKKIIIL